MSEQNLGVQTKAVHSRKWTHLTTIDPSDPIHPIRPETMVHTHAGSPSCCSKCIAISRTESRSILNLSIALLFSPSSRHPRTIPTLPHEVRPLPASLTGSPSRPAALVPVWHRSWSVTRPPLWRRVPERESSVRSGAAGSGHQGFFRVTGIIEEKELKMGFPNSKSEQRGRSSGEKKSGWFWMVCVVCIVKSWDGPTKVRPGEWANGTPQNCSGFNGSEGNRRRKSNSILCGICRPNYLQQSVNAIVTTLDQGLQPKHHHPLIPIMGYTWIYPIQHC